VTFELDKHLGLDLGYRYARVFSSTPINSGRVYAGLQVAF
jgi:hypothetical protein